MAGTDRQTDSTDKHANHNFCVTKYWLELATILARYDYNKYQCSVLEKYSGWLLPHSHDIKIPYLVVLMYRSRKSCIWNRMGTTSKIKLISSFSVRCLSLVKTAVKV